MQLTAIFHFYRQFLIPTTLISLVLLFLSGYDVAFIAAKVIYSIAIIWGYSSSKQNDILSFYHNIGISKRSLFLTFILLDVLLGLIVIQLKMAFS